MEKTTITTTEKTSTTFENLKRTFENAYATKKDYSNELYSLATAVTYSVINKCIDPQKKTAQARDSVSNSGYNPAMVELKNGIVRDLHTLKNTAYCASIATRTAYNADGDIVTIIADADANKALASFINDTLTDSIDLIHTAITAILTEAKNHAGAPLWLDSVYTVNRLSRRVYIQRADSVAYKDINTTPIQEIYRVVRQAIQDSRAIATNPRNGYSYIDELTADGLDTIYYRLSKYADLGGYNVNGQYTTDERNVIDCDAIIEKMGLTDRQAQILKLRMSGKGYKAIATYLGVSQRAIAKTVEQIQKKAVAIGFTADNLK